MSAVEWVLTVAVIVGAPVLLAITRNLSDEWDSRKKGPRS